MRLEEGVLEEEDDPSQSLLPKAPTSPRRSSKPTLTFREQIHEALEEPKTFAAKAFCNSVLIAIVLSTAAFILQSMHSLEAEWYWWPIEVAVVTLFTVEILLRYWVWPGTTFSFLSEPMVFIDICALVPFYLQIIAHYTTAEHLPDLRWMRVLRLVRLFKLGRYSPHLQFMARAISRSLSGLALLVFMLLLTLLIISTIMWMHERGEWDEELNCYARSDKRCSPYQSICHSMWWAITTMTTVGYGDTYPIGLEGKATGASAMLLGIVMLALPTTVLGVQFGSAYTKMKHEDACLNAIKECDTDRILRLQKLTKDLFDYRDEIMHVIPSVQDKVMKELGKTHRDHYFKLGAQGLADEAIASLIELCRTIDDFTSTDIKIMAEP